MTLFFVDGNIDCFETSDSAAELIENVVVIGAESGPTSAIKEFRKLNTNNPEAKVLTNCLELLNNATYDENAKNFNVYFFDDATKDFIALKDLYPKLERRANLADLFLFDKNLLF